MSAGPKPKSVKLGPWVKTEGIDRERTRKWLAKQDVQLLVNTDNWGLYATKSSFLICEGGSDTIDWARQLAKELKAVEK